MAVNPRSYSGLVTLLAAWAFRCRRAQALVIPGWQFQRAVKGETRESWSSKGLIAPTQLLVCPRFFPESSLEFVWNKKTNKIHLI